MAARALCKRYCEVFHCSPPEFSERVFWQCLPPRAVRVARLIRPAKSNLFEPDFELIEQVADATTVEDMRDELDDFH